STRPQIVDRCLQLAVVAWIVARLPPCRRAEVDAHHQHTLGVESPIDVEYVDRAAHEQDRTAEQRRGQHVLRDQQRRSQAAETCRATSRGKRGTATRKAN